MPCYTRKSILLIRILTCITLVLVFGIIACNSDSEELQYQTIQQEQYVDSSKMYESLEPLLVIFTQMEDVNNLKEGINDIAREKLRILDYSKSFAVLILQGYKPGLCYGVNVTKITRLRDNVMVYADFTEARPDIECAAMVSSPYHLVEVEKTGSWSQDTTFDLIVNQVQVVSIRHFIP